MSVTVARKARKDRRCDSCNKSGKIKPCDYYLAHTALRGDEFGYLQYGYQYPGRPQRSTECVDCANRYGRGDLIAARAAQ